jgi:predicted transposase/invertase (TIGR01784 family)
MTDKDVFVPEILPPSEDGIFKTLLTHPDAEPVLRDLISSVLDIPVASVKVRNTELPISDIGNKRERLDVNCVTDDGRQIDVEMQTRPMEDDAAEEGYVNLRDRAVYYLCDLHSSQKGRGVAYSELMRSYQIMFCGFTVFPNQEDFLNHYGFRDKDGVLLSDAVGIVFVELSKLGAVMKKPVEEMTGAEMWSVFFGHASESKYRDILKRMIEAKEEIKMASELLMDISKDEIERAHYRSRKMYLMDEEHKAAVRRKAIEKMKTLQNEMNTLQNEKNTLQNEMNTLQNEKSALQNEKGVLQNENETLQNENETLQSEIIKSKAETARKLLSMNLSVNTVMEATELTRSEVETLLTGNRPD